MDCFGAGERTSLRRRRRQGKVLDAGVPVAASFTARMIAADERGELQRREATTVNVFLLEYMTLLVIFLVAVYNAGKARKGDDRNDRSQSKTG